MSVIFHLAPAGEQARLEHDAYTAPSLAEEGFIHCSYAAQVPGSANKHFAGRTDLTLFVIDADRLSADVRVENGFPHIYGAIDLEAIIDVVTYAPGADGTFGRHEESYGWHTFGALDIDEVHARVTDAMKGYGRPWWVAGAWALDLHLGRRTRPHADIEISVLRADLPVLSEHLRGLDVQRVVAHATLEPWDGSSFGPPSHQLWTRDAATEDTSWQAFAEDPTHLDFLVEDVIDDRWVFRRDERITLPRAEIGARTSAGVPYVRPEIALLYKAKGSRFKDQRDFRVAVPHMDTATRGRLAEMLRLVEPDHRWLRELA